jgi:hypothetical protein
MRLWRILSPAWSGLLTRKESEPPCEPRLALDPGVGHDGRGCAVGDGDVLAQRHGGLDSPLPAGRGGDARRVGSATTSWVMRCTNHSGCSRGDGLARPPRSVIESAPNQRRASLVPAGLNLALLLLMCCRRPVRRCPSRPAVWRHDLALAVSRSMAAVPYKRPERRWSAAAGRLTFSATRRTLMRGSQGGGRNGCG